jgi:hypothetical protein
MKLSSSSSKRGLLLLLEEEEVLGTLFVPEEVEEEVD